MKMSGKLFSLLIFFVFLLASQTVSASPGDDPDRLEAFLDGVIYSQMDEHTIVGVTLAVVQDGELILSKGYGYADRENRIPVDPAKTLFRTGSTGKLFTWTAVMQLVEEGLIDLETDINEYLDFEIPDQLYGHGSSVTPGPITMAHLLTHTAGFEESVEDLFVLSAEKMPTLEKYLKNFVPARVFPPGEIMAYSNYGAALAGYIVERISGITFAEYVDLNIYEPLGMKRSSFHQPLPDNLASDMANGYNFFMGQYHTGSFEYIGALPAGSMSSTAEDMASFMIAHLQDGSFEGNRILQEATARDMHKQQLTHHPMVDGMTYGFIEEAINGRRVIGHGGNTFLFATGCYLLPTENVGLFVSYNSGTGMERDALFTAFMDRYYPAHKAKEPVPSADSLDNAAAYLGEYQPTRASFSSAIKLFSLLSAVNIGADQDGYLILNLTGEPQQFVEIESGVYRARYTEGTNLIEQIAFVEDSQGRLMMAAGGPVFNMIRVPWYGSSALAGMITAVNILLLLTAVGGWLYASAARRICKEKSNAPKPALAARITVVASCLLILILVSGLVGILTDIHPAFGVPRIFIEGTTALDSLLALPYFILLTTALMLTFTVLAWIKKYWTRGGRIHYTAITVSNLSFVWLMLYVNLL